MATKAELSRVRAPADPLEALGLPTKQYVDLLDRANGVGSLRALRPALSWGQDSATTTIQHTAFPSVVQRRDGVLYMVFRRGTNHSATRDGGVWYSTSTDVGRTWATPTQLFAASGGVEYRDPCVSLDSTGTILRLTYFKGSASLSAAGCFFRTSTDGGANWSSETRFDGSKPYAACSAPVVELSNGRLIAPFYGKDNLADARDSCYIATSTNGGTSWTQSKVMDGVGAGTDLQEPWVSRKPGANDLFMTFRWGTNTSIANSSSTQTDGAGWSAPSVTVTGTGRPSTCWLSTGEIVMTYRDTNNQFFWARMYVGGSWSAPVLVRRGRSSGFWTYAQPYEVSPGMALCPFTEENSGATPSKLYSTALVRGGGSSPIGEIPSDAIAVANGYDEILFATTFRERMPATLSPEWTVQNGGLSISADGYLTSTAADNTPDLGTVDVNNANVIIEADLYMNGQAGAGVIFRVVNSNTYLMWTLESSGGAAHVYKVVSGTATALDALGAGTYYIMNTWNTLRVEVHGTIVRVFLNGQSVTGLVLAGGDATTFGTSGVHGVKLNAQSGGAHYCRRFLVKGY